MKTEKEINNMSLEEYEKYIKEEYSDLFNYIKNYNNNNESQIQYEFYSTIDNVDNINKKLKITGISNTSMPVDMIVNNYKIPVNTDIKNINLTIKKYPDNTLPDNLHIEKGLYLYVNSNVEYFGKNTKIEQDLIAIESDLRNLDNIKIYNDIDLSESKYITTLPDDLIVNNLDISYTRIKTTGKNTIIKGNFIASDSEFEFFRDDLQLFSHKNFGNSNDENNIIINNSNVNTIPKTYKDKGFNFVINNTLIKNIEEFHEQIQNKKINFYYDCRNISIHLENIKNFIDCCNNKNTPIVKKIVDEYANHSSMITILLYKNYIEHMFKNKNNELYNINKNLLLNQLDKINIKDLKKIILEENKLSNSNKKNRKGLNLIDCCYTEKTFMFLMNNKYNFTENELKTIVEKNRKTYYEKTLITQNSNKMLKKNTINNDKDKDKRVILKIQN